MTIFLGENWRHQKDISKLTDLYVRSNGFISHRQPLDILEIEKVHQINYSLIHQSTEVRFASFLSGGFITAILVNPPERKQSKRISVQSVMTIWHYHRQCWDIKNSSIPMMKEKINFLSKYLQGGRLTMPLYYAQYWDIWHMIHDTMALYAKI